MKKILFVCGANIGRSQIAEGYYNYLSGERAAISAGVEANKYSEKFSNRPIPQIITLMKEDGIDISQQRVKQIQEEMIQSVDRVVVLCSKKTCPPKLLSGAKEIIYAHMPDPYLQPVERMRQIRDEIKAFVMELLKD